MCGVVASFPANRPSVGALLLAALLCLTAPPETTCSRLPAEPTDPAWRAWSPHPTGPLCLCFYLWLPFLLFLAKPHRSSTAWRPPF